MGRALGGDPKSLTLLVLLYRPDYRAALAYDFRTILGLPLHLVTSRRMRWAEAWGYVSELLRDPRTHTYAAIQGWSYVPSAAEVAGMDQIEMWANAKRARNTVPIRLDRPWETRRRDVEEGPRTPDPQRAERRARLDQMTRR